MAIETLQQTGLAIASGATYRLSFFLTITEILASATLTVKQGTQTIGSFGTVSNGTRTIQFVADASGTELTFSMDTSAGKVMIANITDVSLKEVVFPGAVSLGPELITSSFTGALTGWGLLTNWAYGGSNNAVPTGDINGLRPNTVDVEAGAYYRISFDVTGAGTSTFTWNNTAFTVDSSISFAADIGHYSIDMPSAGADPESVFILRATASGGHVADDPTLGVTGFSVRKITSGSIAVNENIVTEFLTGTTDFGREIFFRVDTQPIQLMSDIETFANPIGIMTKLQRGTLVRCFVSLDSGAFYPLEGNATKGVSLLKIHSPGKTTIPSPPIARKIQVSWRDSSKMLCRLTQGAILFLPSTMDYSE